MDWSEELCGGLLRAVPDAVLVLQDGRITQVNDHAEGLFGRRREELTGHSAAALFTNPGLAAELLAGAPGDRSASVRRADGTEVPVEITSSGGVAVVRDCTDRVRLRHEVAGHRNARLDSLGQLAGGIAHDFNNLLGVIVNYASFVIEEAGSPTADLPTIAADAAQVLRAGNRGTDLTHQLLSFARREVVRPRPVDLAAVLAEAEPAVREALGESVALTVRPALDLPPALCDPAQIEMLLLQLTANARDAMPGGGQLVIDTAPHPVPPGHVELDAGDYIRLRVCDSGDGMTPEVAERAFEPFFTTKASGEGPGLGLATAYGIVTQAGGSIALSSEPGVGTTVTMLLPVAPRDAAVAADESAPAALSPSTGETLLVVDAEAALRDVAGRILSGAGYHVITADNGAHALELAARHEGAIDLLLSDVVMPGMLGNELAERLAGARPGTRVLYMSGYAQPVLASQGTLDPGIALLEKPFTAADLLTAVRERLDG